MPQLRRVHQCVQRHESRLAKLAAGYQRLKTASVKGNADSE